MSDLPATTGDPGGAPDTRGAGRDSGRRPRVAVLFGGRYRDPEARKALEQPVGGPLVQISVKGTPHDRAQEREAVEVSSM